MHVVICDDSALARKSLHRTISAVFEFDVVFCENGQQALDHLAAHPVDILFLDLTMPIVDGFGVLQALPVNDYPTQVIVVSGDVQQEAKNRCLALGAIDFIEKPFNRDAVFNLLSQIGVTKKGEKGASDVVTADEDAIDPQVKFKELINVALGLAAAIVSDKIGIFIELPIPTVGVLETSELNMAITDALQRENLHGVAQRFVGSGFHGEALVCMRGEGIDGIGRSLGFSPEQSSLNEIVLNLSNLLISTFLNSLSDQMGIDLSLRQPVTLKNSYSERCVVKESNEAAFAVEFTYYAENTDFECEVLLFFDQQSVGAINSVMDTL
ncbi:response regulator [Vibrio sp. WJH972]